MKFRELTMLCNASAYSIRTYDAMGNMEEGEIHMDYVAGARKKLEMLRDAEVVRILPCVTKWPCGDVSTLEVELYI